MSEIIDCLFSAQKEYMNTLPKIGQRVKTTKAIDIEMGTIVPVNEMGTIVEVDMKHHNIVVKMDRQMEELSEWDNKVIRACDDAECVAFFWKEFETV